MKKLNYTFYSIHLVVKFLIIITFSGCAHDRGESDLVLVAQCLPVNIQVYGDLTWTDEDATVLKSAKDGCIRYYGQGSCLKTFRKTDERTYEAICSNSHHTTP